MPKRKSSFSFQKAFPSPGNCHVCSHACAWRVFVPGRGGHAELLGRALQGSLLLRIGGRGLRKRVLGRGKCAGDGPGRVRTVGAAGARSHVLRPLAVARGPRRPPGVRGPGRRDQTRFRIITPGRKTAPQGGPWWVGGRRASCRGVSERCYQSREGWGHCCPSLALKAQLLAGE